MPLGMLQNFPVVETVWLILEEKMRKLHLYAVEESKIRLQCIHNCRRKGTTGKHWTYGDFDFFSIFGEVN